jgi:hypothetical protein
MHINEIDDFIDKVIDDYFTKVISDDKTLPKIYKETYFKFLVKFYHLRLLL